MSSPGPTVSMLARKVRLGDVLFVVDEPHAVVDIEWVGNVVQMTLDDGGTITANLDDPLDVTRPFVRHDTAGERDI